MNTKEMTLDDLYARVVKDGDCLIWKGYASCGKFPQWRADGKVQPARRIVYKMTHGYVPKLQIGTTCGNTLCVCPDHLVARSRAAVQCGKPLSLERKLKITRAHREKSKLTIDDVRAIRASPETGAALERHYGLSPGYVSHIRAGQAWRDYANPWMGLGAK